MDFARARSFMIRHRTSAQEISLLTAVVCVGLYLAFEYDFFKTSADFTEQGKMIQLDEALFLGAIVAIGLLLFSIRRYFEQRREMRRRVAAEQHVRELAFQDPLTGLPNRRQFNDALKAAIAAPPRAGAVHALFLLDLNGFKQVNDTHGHNVGDEVLVIASQRLAAAMRYGDLIARLGGDEFAVLTLHLASAEAATTVALRIIDALAEPIVTGTIKHQVGSGIGVSLIPDDAMTPEQAMRKADVALYRAKEERRSAMRFFEDEMDKRVQERQFMEQELHAAVADESIQTYFLASIDLRSKRVVGFEALPQWSHPVFGEIAADRFIPIAEETGLIHVLSDQILRQACVTAAQWPRDIVLSIDVRSSQLKDKKLKDRMLSILQETGFPPERLEIQITESALVRDLEAAQEILGGLREAGAKITLDNFGTGYSSLYHLRNFKMDKIKIDRSFIRGMISEQESGVIVRALVGLAHGLGLTVAADGIQDPEQQASLIRSGCEQGQGYLYSGPVTAQHTLEVIQGTLVPELSS
jgi:diguanylate cyclase (GGDEF)-like protein